ncbi:predicted protein [Sclerotinia sclerotiorum 1980 UF-70]|uniref:Uncharacterized protein n=2 Tax=Sclerotinia sclerotiorum (strain ATCC 18683 / 1980 / Ss-1) TaxID=665079 RepID=A7F607_SCLS1|nr:predicted protein [Sclerotinia sclerotiorum 1980 UF-70]APA07388.1 hypothetical protein sscle_02g021580 [Sclerotinia sclerotiorum 1980 UF-70]EDN98178.1 predicted protein [Sclerotinia sclerotiorum 1980 UF-70]
MKFTSSISFLLGCLTASAAVIDKRTTSSFHLYAYGKGIGGLPVYYSDGNAFVGSKFPSGSNVNTNITFAPSSSSEWAITPTAGNVTLANTTSPVLFIDPSATALTNVGFTGSASSNGTTKGFMSFGNWAMWKNPSTSKIVSNFYATPVSDGVWQLKWNAQEIDDGSSVSVAVRKVAPSTK